MVQNHEIAHATNRARGAASRVEGAAAKLARAEQKLEQMTRDGVDRAARVEAVLLVEDLAAAVASAERDLAAAQAAEARLRDLVKADRLEKLGEQLAEASAGIDAAMIALVQAFEAHRRIMLQITEVSPGLTRDLMYRHQHRLPARSAAQFHGISPRFVPLQRSAFGAAPFSTAGTPELAAEVERLRSGEVPEQSEEAA